MIRRTRRGGLNWKTLGVGALAASAAPRSTAHSRGSSVGIPEMNRFNSTYSSSVGTLGVGVPNLDGLTVKDVKNMVMTTTRVLMLSVENPGTVIASIKTSSLHYEQPKRNQFLFFEGKEATKPAVMLTLSSGEKLQLFVWDPQYSGLDVLISMILAAGATYYIARRKGGRRRRSTKRR